MHIETNKKKNRFRLFRFYFSIMFTGDGQTLFLSVYSISRGIDKAE